MSRSPDSQQFAANVEKAITLMAEAFARHRVAHALIGGMAIAYRANPRSTVDIDFIVGADALQMGRLVDDLVGEGFSPDLREILRRWSVRTAITSTSPRLNRSGPPWENRMLPSCSRCGL